MSCSKCNTNPCNCSNIGTPAFIVNPPDGSVEGEFDPPCVSCTEEVDDCCNILDWKAEGNAFVLSKPGDLLIPEPLQDPVDQCGIVTCCDDLTPQLITTICPPRNLAPGTYLILARLTVSAIANPYGPAGVIKKGTTVAMRWARSCEDPLDTPIEFLRYHKDCCCDEAPISPRPNITGEIVHVNGTLLAVTAETQDAQEEPVAASCLPVLQLYGVAGCPFEGAPTERITNLQVLMAPLSARDFVQCAGALQSIIPPEPGCGEPS